jgi:hypothetical protein
MWPTFDRNLALVVSSEGSLFIPQNRRTCMPKFMSSHSLPSGTLKREQVDQMAAAARRDPVVKPYRSFLNLAEGKVLCVMEAPNKDALAAWFSKMQMPCDDITPVELEGERGVVKEA